MFILSRTVDLFSIPAMHFLELPKLSDYNINNELQKYLGCGPSLVMDRPNRPVAVVKGNIITHESVQK